MASELGPARPCPVRRLRGGGGDRRGPEGEASPPAGPRLLATAALGAFAYWLAHASVDWFWHYAGVTAPVVFMLGAAAAPALREARERPPGIAMIGVAVALVVVVVSLAQIPLFLSERYLREESPPRPPTPTPLRGPRPRGGPQPVVAGAARGRGAARAALPRSGPCLALLREASSVSPRTGRRT